MNKFSWVRWALTPIALALLSSCAVQRVNESFDRAEFQGRTAGQYTKFLQNQQPQQNRDTVVFSNKPWVSTEPLVTRRGLPFSLDRDIAYRPAGPVSITDVAQLITKETGLQVIVAPDALNPGILSSKSAGTTARGAAQAVPDPDSLAGLLPNGMAGAMPGSASSFDLGLGSGGLISGLNYNGKTSGLLNQATSRLGLSWHFDPELQGVRITYFDTRTFDVWTFGDELEIESTVKSGLLTSTGNGDSGSSTSSGGATGESGSNQSTKSTYKTSLMSDIESNVKAMLSMQPPGRLYLSRSTGTLTVSDRPEVLNRISAYLKDTNRSITRQVLFNVKVYEVNFSDSDQTAVNWSAVYKSISGKWGFGLSNTVAGISSEAISASGSILDTSSSPWAGSKAVVQALSEQGRVSEVRSPSVTTLNLQPAPIQIGNVQSYVASSSTTTTASVGSSTALTPATITSGFNMMLLPKLLDKENMLLMITLSISSKPIFKDFESNDSKVQTTDYDTKNVAPKVRLRSGETLILTGFDENGDDARKSGVGSPSFFGLGGGRTRSTSHSALVVLVTPIVLPDNL
ncbi:PilN family type IVB pilus formation outer membrane protein [Pseudomonas juntendi]|jgi:type IVB pilus formation R64 PilN family outer membrane protein|uniref:PilN family type IVB pilus formation outer membrane protein n=3 Tax=Pseudomonas TaxID=286 RepID=A0ABX9AYR2_9PSED|nr:MULTISPECIES: PilN family type IVB pilus formation outer membrane protein [Pseudomonas]AIN57081.1 secretin [Pseudomonas soli]MBS3183671.1 PilN family type IVB pilus formation outer membrane protein [Pseudomonas sp. PCH44]MCE0852383.1 PilN family type IVB pilus formation outer membrane protein [Pseudomonas asiatica]MCE0876789.1 PilN family type IVB pilus formation outer membrane protein [Pseudomonas monteilii]MCE0926708.1 PilN family type IVB pilus formation outer membrane protein [Pseudomon